MNKITESTVESAALAWLEGLNWSVKHGPEIIPGDLFSERSDYSQVVLEQRLARGVDSERATDQLLANQTD